MNDGFGVSWQVAPTALESMLRDADRDGVDRVARAFLGVKKLELAALRVASGG